MRAIALFLPLIALVGIGGYVLPRAAAGRHEPPRMPAWAAWVRATAGWICVCLGVSMGLVVKTTPGRIAASCIFLVVVGVMQALWARDATRHLR